MKRKTALLIATLWIVSLVGVAVWAQSPGPTMREGRNIGDVITGDNIGFQRVVAPTRSGAVVGRWMVKIDGQWRVTEPPITVVR